MQNLKIYNTLTRQKEEFKPLNPPYIGMYVCGPTVYNYVHLGNVRTFLTFDVLFRYLTEIGYKVRYVRNITDVGHLVGDGDEGEDKIGKMAKLEKLEPMEIVQRYTNDFHKVLDQFNFLPPSIEPTATGHLVEQIEAVQTLIDKGLAYESNGSVYFDINKYNSEGNDYGKLSGRILEDLLNETRELDGQSEKRNPLDFAIWKNASPEHIMQWKSPWGMGFPGWHLECTCMSTKYLGKQFDIHGGGMDLKFPHHECEIAQGVGITGVEPVRYWMHSNMLTVNGQKMSKSLGNSFLPSELFAGSHPLLDQAYSPMTVRFFMLQSQYRSTLDFSNDALRASQKGYRRLINGLRIVKTLTLDVNDKPAEIIPSELIDDTYSNEENTNNRLNSALRTITKYQGNLPLNTILGKLQTDHNYSNEEVEKVRIILLKTAPIGEEKPIDEKKKLDIEKTVQAFYEAMNDDLNTAVAIAQLFNLLKYVNMIYMNQLDPRALGDDTFNLLKEKFVLFMEQILGIKEETSTQTDGILNGMLSLYKEYKSSQRYDKVDEIRTYFKSNGMTIKDMKHRIDWAWEE